MKLYEIKLLKEAFETRLTEEQAIAFILGHCRDALRTIDTPIVRGMEQDEGVDFLKFVGQDGGRESRSTTNHYTTILDDVLPEGYPERSKSIICINYDGIRYAENYGDVFAIIPQDGVKIGVCPDQDIWATEIELGRKSLTLEKWNDVYDELGLSDQYYLDFIHGLESAVETVREMDDEDSPLYTLVDVEDLDEMIREAYTEQFQLATTAKAFEYNDGAEHELWIGGPCIAVRMDEWDEFKDLLKAAQR